METSEEWVVYRREGWQHLLIAMEQWRWEKWQGMYNPLGSVTLIAEGLTKEQATNFVRLAEESE